MKKKLVTVLLASSMVATMLAGCGSGSGDGTEKGSSAKGGDGSVYMLNFKPETDQAWQDLAEKYTDETGVQVTVVTAADGQYKTTLKSELAKKEAPTIFNIGSTADCAEYDKYIYDLKDSEIYKHLTDKSLALEYNGKIASVANCYECYGIIYNKAILENYCKNYSGAVIKSVDDIKDLDTLEKVATDINEHVDDINKACDLHLTGDSQDISQVSSSTMSSRMQDVISQQDRRKLQVSTWTTSREFGICTQIHQQQTRLHLIQEA